MNDTSGPWASGDFDEADDAELVARAQAGGALAEPAINQLLGRHMAYVDNRCKYMLRNRLDAEDARQEALLKAAQRIGTFDGRAQFRTWLTAIVNNVCLNKIRKDKRGNELLKLLRDESDESTGRYDDSVAVKLDVKSSLDQLSEVRRTVVVLRLMFEFTLEQIAEELDIPLNTVKSNLFRGTRQMERLLKEPGG
jgi:RNA polymerase sigma factor (sigma-70 family)